MSKKQPSNGDLGVDALKTFLNQFGKPDIYTQILLETIFEQLFYDSYEEVEIDGETLHLPSEKEQNRCQNGGSSSRTENSNES